MMILKMRKNVEVRLNVTLAFTQMINFNEKCKSPPGRVSPQQAPARSEGFRHPPWFTASNSLGTRSSHLLEALHLQEADIEVMVTVSFEQKRFSPVEVIQLCSTGFEF